MNERVLTSLFVTNDLNSSSRSKVKCRGQRSRSNFWCAAVDIRGSALSSAAKSNNDHYQSKVIVCVSVISVRIIVRMR